MYFASLDRRYKVAMCKLLSALSRLETANFCCTQHYWNPSSCRQQSPIVAFIKRSLTSCAGGRHNMPPPLQVDLWPFNLESGVRVPCDVGYLCAKFSLPRPLCSRLRPDVRDRQTSDAHHRLMPPYPRGKVIIRRSLWMEHHSAPCIIFQFTIRPIANTNIFQPNTKQIFDIVVQTRRDLSNFGCLRNAQTPMTIHCFSKSLNYIRYTCIVFRSMSLLHK